MSSRLYAEETANEDYENVYKNIDKILGNSFTSKHIPLVFLYRYDITDTTGWSVRKILQYCESLCYPFLHTQCAITW